VDTLLTFVVTISGYIIVFVVVGYVFYLIDKRVKKFLAKPGRCVSCRTEVPAGVQMHKGRLCDACYEKKRQRKAASHR